MNSTRTASELAEPHLNKVLAAAGLDVEYVRAEGNTLYQRGDDGQDIPVLDYASGYGSLILGHHHPEIVARAKELLENGTPVHAQFSAHPYAGRLAEELNRIIHRETGTDEPYFATFANSGAEAVEAAMKHAELDRVLRLAERTRQAEARVETARSAVVREEATVPDELFGRLGLDLPAPGATDEEKLRILAAETGRLNAAQTGRAPLFLALEGGFHGKLSGSVQLTHNEDYRAPFRALAAQARFVPRDRPDVLSRILAEERGTLLHLGVAGGRVQLEEHVHYPFCAFLLEPIQGEGGIHPLTKRFAQEIQQFCETADCPVVVDEIQSGMGRTGTLLASSQLGLRGDYYVLAKSLGGGIAKASVMLVREARYRAEFEMVHSSTFAKDGFSCHIALKVLELLEADGGQAYRRATERGKSLEAMLHRVRDTFPDVIEDVRGRGLMLGLEFRDQSESGDRAVQEASLAGHFGYAVAGYLLRRHRIRTFPTASAVRTLRFEPSLLLTDGEIEQLRLALTEVCTGLREQNLLAPGPGR